MRLVKQILQKIRIDIFYLAIAYILSQYFRVFLSVLTPVLSNDLGARPDHFSNALAFWFFAFALMQFPVGWALDRIGPRRTVSGIFLIAAIGAGVFAVAQTPQAMIFAMVLLGIGCSPILMSAYFIFARDFAPKAFATMAGMVIGFGLLGNLAASIPTDWAVGTFGWRAMLWGLAVVCVMLAGVLFIAVRDPEIIASNAKRGSVLDIFKIRALWFIFPLVFVQYSTSAALRGVWIGPYFTEVLGAPDQIAKATFIMGIGMILGSFLYGPLDQIFKTRKWIILAGSILMITATFTLALSPVTSLQISSFMFFVVGFMGAGYPMMAAHARAFLPAHLVGRGITIVNCISISGVGAMQFASSGIYKLGMAANAESHIIYSWIFCFLGGITLIGWLIYLRAEDRLD